MPVSRTLARAFTVLAIAVAELAAQTHRGELRLQVLDPAGKPLPAQGTLRSDAHQYRREFTTDAAGKYQAQPLRLGRYQLEVQHAGFTTYSTTLEIDSELPISKTVTLGLAAVETSITIDTPGSLLDPYRPSANYTVGAQSIRERPASLPGRDLLDAVDRQPGWLLEANGVLHPRGAEYGAQYVVDGLPLFDNRSPAFAPALEVDELESISVMTSGYPAEFGRKLGGVVELTSARPSAPGFRGRAQVGGGSFDTLHSFLSGQYKQGATTYSFSANAARTDRYLDPPSEANHTNRGELAGVSGSWERDLTSAQRLRVAVQSHRIGFLVPNEDLQEQAGQRQDRGSKETMAQVNYQATLSPRLLLAVRGLVRDLSADLWSNPLSTPIQVFQNRGFREGYLQATLTGQQGRHEWKAGVDGDFASISEQFAYHIKAYRVLGVRIFDRDTPANFQFADRRQNREQAAFIQDQWRAGAFTISAGLRYDHYRLMVDENAVSPRLGIAWQVPHAGLVLRASYDRLFQTPASENLLLSSSEAVRQLNDEAFFLPVRPSRGNQFEVGFSKSLGGVLRWSGSWYRRTHNQFADDDVLLNTGISFPVSFKSAAINGIESQLELPRWRGLSGFISYSWMIGRVRLPIAGGLFLSDEAAELITSNATLPITQDQRNTVRARFRYQVTKRLWTAWGGRYGSGLPIETDEVDLDDLTEQYGERIVSRVNLDRGRVRPSFSLDSSLGIDLWRRERRSAQFQADAINLTNRLNVTNFAGLFSGTALAPTRTVFARLLFTF